ncbi:phosphatase PAP2 family protein [Kitasatospora sp. NPDC057542]|uniref:phosphatase PAP2 family protein n=1 Tax=Kitasatospora sp. NPDC057542 TaxID=3346162 RepID=UPI0036A81D8B
MADRMTRRWLVVLAGTWSAFAVIAAVVAANAWAPFAFEQAAIDWSAAHRPPLARAVAMAVTSLGTGVVPYLLALAAGVVTARNPRNPRTGGSPRSRWTVARALLLPVLWLALGQLLRQGLMHAFGRPRPPETDWAFTASGFAFPSGHAFTSALSAGLLALAVARARPSATRTAAAGAVLFAGVIGLSRIYLGVHWPLDVLAGWLLAVGWLAGGAALSSFLPEQKERSDSTRAP